MYTYVVRILFYKVQTKCGNKIQPHTIFWDVNAVNIFNTFNIRSGIVYRRFSYSSGFDFFFSSCVNFPEFLILFISFVIIVYKVRDESKEVSKQYFLVYFKLKF